MTLGKMSLAHRIVILFLLLACTGCASFSGSVVFVNKSAKKVWVGYVDGFERRPPAGALVPKANAGALMGRMSVPDEVILHWSYEFDKTDKRSVLQIAGTPPPDRDAALQIIFTSEEIWTFQWDTRR